MRLRQVAHGSFRNLDDDEVALAPSTTVLLGDNGQGKTSFLEAIGVLSSTRSFRRAKAAEISRHGTDTFHVRGELEEDDGRRVQLAVQHQGGRRETWLGGVEVPLSEYVGQFSVVAITSAHAAVVRGSPQDRRDFLDRGLLGIHDGYLQLLASHRRTLRQKNALLRRCGSQPGPEARRELLAWNERLVDDGAGLVLARRGYVRRLRQALETVGPRFLPDSEPLRIGLQDVVSRHESLSAAHDAGEDLDPAEVRQALHELTDAQLERELASGAALVGPHRDDLRLETSGRDLRRFASSGQQRNALLALKVAKVEIFQEKRGEPPLLLVDDVDTEIDPTRLRTFLERVGGQGQAVLTSSKRDLFPKRPEDAIFYEVRSGSLTEA
ncbi:MAG: DNA replication and repair protein RecF [Acidobacteriota bacterium]